MVSDNIFDSLNLDRNKVNLGEALNEQPGTPQVEPETQPEETVAQTPTQAVEVPETAAVEQEVEAFTFGEGLDHALIHETLMGFGAKALAAPDFEPDPDFAPTLGYYEENFADIPRHLHDHLYEAESFPELQYRAEELRLRLEDEARFNEMSTGSQIGTLLASTVLDAPAIAATLLISTGAGAVTGGTGAAPGYAATATRLGITGKRVAKVLGIGAGVATEAAIHEAILASRDPLKNEQTVMLAGLMGFGFGAVGGEIGNRLATRNIRKAAAKDQKKLTEKLIKDAAEEVTTGKKPVRDFKTTSSTEGSALEQLYDAAPGTDSSSIRNVAIDQTSRLKRSKDEGFRNLGEILGEDGIFGGGSTMAIEFDTTTRPVLADALKSFDGAYKQWAKDNDIGLAGRIGHKGRQEFNERMALVTRGVIDPETPAERMARMSTRKFFREMLGIAKTSGVKGFEDIDESLTYLTRQYSHRQFQKITNDIGAGSDAVIKRILKGSLKSASKASDDVFDDEIAEAISKGIYNRFMSTKLAPDDKFTTVLTNNFKDELEGILTDADLDAKKIEEILAKVTAKEESGLGVAKRRINFDESFVDTETGLRFTDLLENNTEQIMVRYARQVGGASAAAKFGFETPQSLINHIQKTADKAFQSGALSEGAAKSARSNAENLANQILGRPNEQHGTLQQFAQYLMDYEYIRTSGGFALASLPEMLITTAENGLDAVLKHTPMANKFIKDIRKGVKPDEELLSVLESFGIGRDIDMMNAFVRIAEDDALSENLSKGVKVLNAGKRVAGLASGLPQLTRFSQVLAGKSTIQRFTDLAYKNKPVKLKQWLKQLGFANEADLENVFVGLRKYTTTHQGFTKNRTVVGLDFNSWMKEDPVAATRFMHAVARRVNHQIQRNLPGETPEFMSKTWGKLFTQFQTFGIAAYGKKTLNAVARRDMESAVAIGYTMAGAAMVYAARMYVIAQAKDDPEGFLRERLSPENMVKASIQRSGFASVLPTIVDHGLGFTGQDRIFNDYARTSGLDVGGVESIPAAQTVLNLGKTAGAVKDAVVDGDRIEEKDVRAATDTLPLRRLPGINFLFESLINEFPQRGRER